MVPRRRLPSRASCKVKGEGLASSGSAAKNSRTASTLFSVARLDRGSAERFTARMDDFAAALNEHRDGWVTAMDMRFVRATRDEVVMEWVVGAQHRQLFGIVHG